MYKSIHKNETRNKYLNIYIYVDDAVGGKFTFRLATVNINDGCFIDHAGWPL